jgi:hypothetical protein
MAYDTATTEMTPEEKERQRIYNLTDTSKNIVVPKHLKKLYESAMRMMNEEHALQVATIICEDVTDFDKDSLELMDKETTKRYYACSQFVLALDIECPTCRATHIKKKGWEPTTKKIVSAASLNARKCLECKTPITLEWEV